MSLGLEGAFGANEFQKALRQQVMDRLQQEQQKFQNDLASRGADRADRQQQILEAEHADALKERSLMTREKIAGDTAANLSPNTVVPAEMGQRFAGTSIAPLLKPDATLPSTQMSAGAPLAGADTSSTAPAVTQKPSVLTGQLRFTGTPKQVETDRLRTLNADAAKDTTVPPSIRGFLRMNPDASGVPAEMFKPPPTDPTKTHEANRLFDLAHPTPKDTTNADLGRMDKSFTYTDKQLSDLAKPLSDQAERIGRLRATINQMSPQADAVIAPELLTAMAGGAGSGLRMNEAEISRIVGGRSKWESLKASLNQWSTDPSKALSVTDDQRTQMRSLVKAIAERGQQRLQDIGNARRSLIDATDVNTHRRIVQDVTDKLNASAIGSDEASGGTTETWVRDPTSRKLVKSSGR